MVYVWVKIHSFTFMRSNFRSCLENNVRYNGFILGARKNLKLMHLSQDDLSRTPALYG
jgi:hypothetical protein